MVRQERALSAEDAARIEEVIGRVKDYAPGHVAELELALHERYTKPDLAFSLVDPLNELTAVFEPGLVRIQGTGLIAGVNEPAGEDGFIPTKVPCQGDIEIQGKFTLDSAATAGSRFGLVLNAGKGRGYNFTLSPTPAPGIPRRALMTIQRNKVVLRKAEVDLPDTMVSLFAQKKGDTVSFTVGKTTLSFDDIFPLSTGNPGVFGIVLPAEVRLDGLAAWKQRVPDSPSPLEKGDALYIAEDFDNALPEFEKVENTTESAEMKAEAGYKKALCLLEKKREENAKPIFERIAADKGPFQTRAACQVWKILLRSGTVADIEKADNILNSLSANVDYVDLIRVLSEEERDKLLSYYRQAGYFNRANWNPDVVRNLERAYKIQEYVRVDPLTRQRTLWRLADAYRVDGREADAVDAIGKLLSDPELIPDDRIGITRDYAWLMITGGTPRKALDEFDQRIGPGQPGPDDRNFPMLFDRARVHAALRNWDQAEADVARFIVLAKKPSISYNDFAAACLFHGFLLERRGRKDEAVTVWRAGLRKNWPKDLPVISPPDRLLDGKPLRDNFGSLLHFAMLVSLTRELGEDEIRAITSESLGSGDFKSSPIVKIVEFSINNSKTGVTSPEHIRAIIIETYNTPENHEFARREAYLETTLREQTNKPLLMAVEAEIRLDAIPEGGAPELAGLIHDGLEEINRSVRDLKFSPEELGMMFLAWTDGPYFLGWGRLENSLKERTTLRGKIAYVYGRRYLTLKKPDLARRLFGLCLSDSPAQSPFRRLAQEQLDRLGAK